MTAIVYDYVAIATGLSGDDWWEPKKIDPLPECPPPTFDYQAEIDKVRSVIEEITFIDERYLQPRLRVTLPEIKWRLLDQGKPVT